MFVSLRAERGSDMRTVVPLCRFVGGIGRWFSNGNLMVQLPLRSANMIGSARMPRQSGDVSEHASWCRRKILCEVYQKTR